jgi:hypothetical protein
VPSPFVTKVLSIALGLLLLGSSLAAAQSPAAVLPAPAAPDSGAVLLFNGWYLPRYQPRAAEADTTGALLSLFRRQRTAGWLYTLPFIAGMTLALPISSTDNQGNQVVADEAISPPLGIALLSATFVGFIVHATAFNQGHLRAVDQAYAAGKPIPAKYRRRLTAKHFSEAAYLREALRQQQAREQARKK